MVPSPSSSCAHGYCYCFTPCPSESETRASACLWRVSVVNVVGSQGDNVFVGFHLDLFPPVSSISESSSCSRIALRRSKSKFFCYAKYFVFLWLLLSHSHIWNIKVVAAQRFLSLIGCTTVIRGPGSGSFDPNTRLTAHSKRRDQSFSKEGGDWAFFFFFPFRIFSCIFGFPSTVALVSLVAQTIKNPPAMQEIWVWSLDGKIPWKRKWQPTPVFLPGEFHGQWSLAGYSPRDHSESDSTEWLTHTTFWKCYFAH